MKVFIFHFWEESTRNNSQNIYTILCGPFWHVKLLDLSYLSKAPSYTILPDSPKDYMSNPISLNGSLTRLQLLISILTLCLCSRISVMSSRTFHQA